MRLSKPIALAFLFVVCFACENNDLVTENSSMELKATDPIYMDLGNTMRTIKIKNKTDVFSKSENSGNATKNYNVALYMAEYITSGNSEEMGNIIYFNNRGNKQLPGDFVPGLAIDGTNNISYSVDDSRPSDDLTVLQTHSAINRAMNTWNDITCSNIGMFELPNSGNSGFIARSFTDARGEDENGNPIPIFVDEDGNALDFGGSYAYFADVNHVGWMPPSFFDILAPDGSQFILGVTFTIVFTDENGNLVDTDNNGKYDVAFREIYYNDAFPWNDGSTFDVETIALHEAGHGLSQGHFGKAFRSRNGKLHFSPRAVMNAAYSGIQTTIAETDMAGHCSNWSSWFNN